MRKITRRSVLGIILFSGFIGIFLLDQQAIEESEPESNKTIKTNKTLSQVPEALYSSIHTYEIHAPLIERAIVTFLKL